MGVRADEPIDLLLCAPAISRQLYGARAGSDLELSAVEMQVLVALSDDPDQRVEDIADRLALRPSSVSHALTALKGADLIDDQPGEGHPRRRHRPLTADGDREVTRLVAEARRLLDEHQAKPQG